MSRSKGFNSILSSPFPRQRINIRLLTRVSITCPFQVRKTHRSLSTRMLRETNCPIFLVFNVFRSGDSNGSANGHLPICLTDSFCRSFLFRHVALDRCLNIPRGNRSRKRCIVWLAAGSLARVQIARDLSNRKRLEESA